MLADDAPGNADVIDLDLATQLPSRQQEMTRLAGHECHGMTCPKGCAKTLACPAIET